MRWPGDDRPVFLLGILSLLAAAGSCGGDSEGGAGPTMPQTPIVTSVELSQVSVSFDALGATHQLTATVRDQNGQPMSGQPLSWSTSNAGVASVAAGLVTALGNGTAQVTASAGGLSATASIVVSQAPAALNLDAAVFFLSGPGDYLALSGAVRDRNGHAVANQPIEWRSTDEAVARVEGGTLVAVSYGTAIIVGRSGVLSDSSRVLVAGEVAEDSLSTSIIPENGELAIYIPGEQLLHIQLSITNDSGAPLAGGTVTHAMTEGHVLMFVTGPPDDGADYIPTVVFGSPSYLSGKASGPTPVGPQLVVEGYVALKLGLMVRSLFEASWQAGEGLYRISEFWWEFATTEGQCKTYAEIAEYYHGRYEVFGGALAGFISIASLKNPLPNQEAGEAFQVLAEEFVSLGVTGAAWELVRLVTAEADLPEGAGIDDYVKVLLDERELEKVFIGQHLTVPYALLMKVGIDPLDPFCAGLVPTDFLAHDPVERSGTVHEISALTVSLRSRYGKGGLSGWGAPFKGVPVTFTVTDGGGSVRLSSSGDAGEFQPSLTVTTDSDGRAEVDWRYGPAVGSQRVQARVDWEGHGHSFSETVSFSAEVSPAGSGQLGVGFGPEQFALIPAGTFQMGDSSGSSNELPVHTVNITKAFYVQKTEVTQGQWRAVMGSNPSFYSACGDTCPVEFVSWSHIQEFLAALNAMDPGKNYRLPTEAEWEYAARAGTTGDYGGTGVLDQMGWYRDNSAVDGVRQTHPVAQKQPNHWGLYDMHGNVWEWVEDWYSGSYYQYCVDNGIVDDPPGPLEPETNWWRVMRGGSFWGYADFARSAYRVGTLGAGDTMGFRLARDQ